MNLNKIVLSSMIVFLILATSIYAQEALTADQERFLNAATLVRTYFNKYTTTENVKDVAAITEIAKILKQKSEIEKFKLPPIARVKQLDSEMRNIIETIVTKNSARLQEAKITIDSSIYRQPLLYQPAGFAGILASPSVRYPFILALILLALNIVRLLFSKEARTLEGFFSIKGLFSWIFLKKRIKLESLGFSSKKASEKVKLTAKDVVSLLEEKKARIAENKASMEKLLAMITSKGTRDFGRLQEQSVRNFETTWKDTLLHRIEELNEKIDNELERYKKFLEKFEKLFSRRYQRAVEHDKAEITKFEAENVNKLGTQAIALTNKMEAIRKLLEKDAILINKQFYPDIDKLANNVRRLLKSVELDKDIIKKEGKALEELSSGHISGTRLSNTFDLLETAVKEKGKQIDAELILAKEIETIEKDREFIQEEIEEKELEIKKAAEITEEMKKHKLKYFTSEKAKYPLLLKKAAIGRRGVTTIPTGEEINSISELRIRIIPKQRSKQPALSIDPVAAYFMLKKIEEEPELVTWIEKACDNPELADEVNKLIDEASLPELEIEELPSVSIEKEGVKGQVEVVPKLDKVLPSLNDLRTRIAEAIDDAYPPLK